LIAAESMAVISAATAALRNGHDAKNHAFEGGKIAKRFGVETDMALPPLAESAILVILITGSSGAPWHKCTPRNGVQTPKIFILWCSPW
jgi:hypothetical protein